MIISTLPYKNPQNPIKEQKVYGLLEPEASTIGYLDPLGKVVGKTILVPCKCRCGFPQRVLAVQAVS